LVTIISSNPICILLKHKSHIEATNTHIHILTLSSDFKPTEIKRYPLTCGVTHLATPYITSLSWSYASKYSGRGQNDGILNEDDVLLLAATTSENTLLVFCGDKSFSIELGDAIYAANDCSFAPNSDVSETFFIAICGGISLSNFYSSPALNNYFFNLNFYS
jgi:hypothetical protein